MAAMRSGGLVALIGMLAACGDGDDPLVTQVQYGVDPAGGMVFHRGIFGTRGFVMLAVGIDNCSNTAGT